jgi:hypothetical protein
MSWDDEASRDDLAAGLYAVAEAARRCSEAMRELIDVTNEITRHVNGTDAD